MGTPPCFPVLPLSAWLAALSLGHLGAPTPPGRVHPTTGHITVESSVVITTVAQPHCHPGPCLPQSRTQPQPGGWAGSPGVAKHTPASTWAKTTALGGSVSTPSVGEGILTPCPTPPSAVLPVLLPPSLRRFSTWSCGAPCSGLQKLPGELSGLSHTLDRGKTLLNRVCTWSWRGQTRQL